MVELRPVADFPVGKPADNFWAEYYGYQEACQYRGNGAEHYVLVGIEANAMGEDFAKMF